MTVKAPPESDASDTAADEQFPKKLRVQNTQNSGVVWTAPGRDWNTVAATVANETREWFLGLVAGYTLMGSLSGLDHDSVSYCGNYQSWNVHCRSHCHSLDGTRGHFASALGRTMVVDGLVLHNNKEQS